MRLAHRDGRQVDMLIFPSDINFWYTAVVPLITGLMAAWINTWVKRLCHSVSLETSNAGQTPAFCCWLCEERWQRWTASLCCRCTCIRRERSSLLSLLLPPVMYDNNPVFLETNSSKAPPHFERRVLSQMVLLVTAARKPEFPVDFASLSGTEESWGTLVF